MVLAAMKDVKSKVPMIKGPFPARTETSLISHSFVAPDISIETVNGASPITITEVIPMNVQQDISKKVCLDYRAFLAGLVLPGYAEQNREALWHVDNTYEVDSVSQKNFQEASKILTGLSTMGINLTALVLDDGTGKDTNIILLEDLKQKKILAIGEQSITPELNVHLASGGVTYSLRTEPGLRTKYNEFLKDALNSNINSGDANTISRIQALAMDISMAFLMSFTESGNSPVIDEGMTFIESIAKARSLQAQIFSKIVKI